jgi:hypothetical protein
MKGIIFNTLAFILIFATNIFSQDIDIHRVIGKSQSEVIKKFGNPVHKDNSNPDMICMFYKTPNRNMVFVADREGVYQAEATGIFDTEQIAQNKIDEFISSSIKDEFTTDTISVLDFQLHKKGVKVDLHLAENKISKKYEIRVKANRTEN